MPYKLSATLAAHSSDVRAVSSPTDGLVLSVSRDSTAISWQRPSPTAPFNVSAVLRAGVRYVNAVTYLPPSSPASQAIGYAVTGGQDTVINIFSLDLPSKEEPDYLLLGHTENVCALHATKNGTIISGSWDRTAKVWKQFRLAYDLKGHEQSVWAVLAVDDDQFLTGSADKTIKFWQQHKVVRTYEGHKDAVRALALIPDIGFASCSNDSEIRVWTVEGDVVYTLSGHTSFVYSLSVLPDGDIVSGGEDRTVRVWHDGECKQTIVHPAISVWAVSTMPNGDIVSGCSDGVVRVFSEVEERWASAEELQTYNDKIASQALPSQQVGDVKASDLPGTEALSTPGKKEGEVKMVKNDGLVEAHQWSSATSSWQKIGDVVDAVGSGRRQLYEGKEYDYVFDVDIQDGVPPLKLPYNVTENPYSAAQRFLARNELPMEYLDEVVRFIEKNTSGVNLGTGSEYVDPFTGASRYQPSAAAPPSAPSASSYMDPFTGASRYSGAPQQPSVSQPVVLAPSAILPISHFVTFKQANLTAMHSKLIQLDDTFRNEISTSSLALFPDEIKLMDEVCDHLSVVAASPSEPSSAAAPIGPAHIEALMQILDRWPEGPRFPVIDLSRLVAGYCSYALDGASGLRDRFFVALFKASEWNGPWDSPIPKVKEINTLLLLRTITNALQEGAPVEQGTWVRQICEELGQAPYEVLTKNQRVACASILSNFSCIRSHVWVDPAVRSQHLGFVLRVLRTEREESEAVYRTLVALGNVAYAAKAHGLPLNVQQASSARQAAVATTTFFTDDRIRSIVAEITQLL